MTPKTAIILWDGLDCSVEHVNNNIRLLQAAQINNIYCVTVASPDNAVVPSPQQCQCLVDAKPIGSFKSVVKALNLFKTNHVPYDDGLIVIYGHAHLTQRTIDKLFQISTITSRQPTIKGFVSVRMTKGPLKQRYNTHVNGTLCKPFHGTQGHEPCGLIMLTPRLLETIKDCPAKQMSDFFNWCIVQQHHLYGIIDGCCGDPYSF